MNEWLRSSFSSAPALRLASLATPPVALTVECFRTFRTVLFLLQPALRYALLYTVSTIFGIRISTHDWTGLMGLVDLVGVTASMLVLDLTLRTVLIVES